MSLLRPVGLGLGSIGLFLAAHASAQSYSLVNTRHDGVQEPFYYGDGMLTEDGRQVFFVSWGESVVPGDTNVLPDVFARDRDTATTERVSISTTGVQVNQPVSLQTVSDDGRFAVFTTRATTLEPLDTNLMYDLYLRDRVLDVTEWVSVNALGGAPMVEHNTVVSISADGRFVVFGTGATDMVAGFDSLGQLLCRDRQTGTNEILSLTPQGTPSNCCNFIYSRRAMSPDGRFVVWGSGASDLVAGDTNGEEDIFLRDRLLGVTERVSLAHDGSQADDDSNYASVTPDGRFVSFSSLAGNLVPIDSNPNYDVFVRDRLFATTRIASLSWNGAALNSVNILPTVSADGRYVSFYSQSTSMTQEPTNFAVRDQIAQTTTPIFPGHPFVYWRETTRDGQHSLAYDNPTGMVPGAMQSGELIVVEHQASDAFQGYCTAKTNSSGCIPVISCSGLPSASGPDDFFATSWNQLDAKFGLFFWGPTSAAIPFAGGTLCVQPPLVRTGVQLSATDSDIEPCTGTYTFHFTQAYMASKGLGAGATLYGQWWGRDPGFAPPNNVSLTGGLAFTIQP